MFFLHVFQNMIAAVGVSNFLLGGSSLHSIVQHFGESVFYPTHRFSFTQKSFPTLVFNGLTSYGYVSTHSECFQQSLFPSPSVNTWSWCWFYPSTVLTISNLLDLGPLGVTCWYHRSPLPVVLLVSPSPLGTHWSLLGAPSPKLSPSLSLLVGLLLSSLPLLSSRRTSESALVVS